jgi:Arc/MetJ family transcription regulator
MRTTVTLDDDLLERAARWSGISSTSDLLNHVLRLFVQREAAARLAELGATMPELEDASRAPRSGRAPMESMRIAEDEP